MNTGFGATIDTTQADASGGSCAKFEYSSGGNGKATVSGGVIENIIKKAGQYTARARVKVSASNSSTELFVLSVQDSRSPFPALPMDKSGKLPEDSDVVFPPSKIGTSWAWVETPFYWDGVTPIELWTGRVGGQEPTIILWEDKVEFVSKD